MGVENAMAMAVASSGFLCVLARLIYLVRQWPSQKVGEYPDLRQRRLVSDRSRTPGLGQDHRYCNW